MAKDRKTLVDKILHRKLNIEPHELHYKMWDELRCSKMAGSSYLWYIHKGEVIYEAEYANPLKAFFWRSFTQNSCQHYLTISNKKSLRIPTG